MSINQQKLPEDQLDRNIRHDWSKIYELSCKELGIQQDKRDKVINLYLVLCSFLIPFAYNVQISDTGRGLIFLVAAIVGFLFTSVVIRYRIYKEVHWITCSAVTKMPYLIHVTKDNVQTMFLDTMKKKASSFYSDGILNYGKFIRKNRSSAETFSFVILVFLTSIMLGLSLYLLGACWKPVWAPIAMAALASLIAFWLRMRSYMRKLFAVYQCLDRSLTSDQFKEAFNTVFEKAWFLHVYFEQQTGEKQSNGIVE